MNKKLVTILTIFSTLILFLLVSGLLSANKICGFEYGHLAKETNKTGKEWSCKCIGIKKEISSSYTMENYCTGINLSNNKLNHYLYNNQQYPVSLD